MDDDLHVAALGDKLDIARIQARRVARLRDAHAVFAAGLVAAQFKAAAHRLRLTVGGHYQRAAAVAHADILSPCQRAACVSADGIAARDAHIHRRQARNGGQIHANRAGNRRPADHAAIRPGRWQQKKRQQQSQQQRRKPFRLYHCHEKIPLSSFSLHPCRKSAKHGTNGIVSHFRPD